MIRVILNFGTQATLMHFSMTCFNRILAFFDILWYFIFAMYTWSAVIKKSVIL